MANERDEEEFGATKAEEKKQATGGQQSHESEFGQQGSQTGGQSATGQAQTGAGSEPPRSMGARGSEFGQMSDYDRSGQQGQSGTGQADLGSQAGSTLSGHTDQQELGEIGGEVDQPASYGEQSQTEGEGFILQQPESASSAKATEGTDFAPQGRGAAEDEDEAGSEGGEG
jgi:hypothetical protein